MTTSPHLSLKLAVGVASLLLTLVAALVTIRSPGYPATPLRSWPTALLGRLREELPHADRRSLAWLALAAWSVLVTVLHFGGVRYGIYTQLPWWDLITHAMGGVGVAGILAMTFRAATLRSPTWLPSGVFAVGAGFEVYEFVFKTFWYRWSLAFYVTDTAVDLVVNATGAVAVAVAVDVYRRRVARAGALDTDGGPDGVDESDPESPAADTD